MNNEKTTCPYCGCTDIIVGKQAGYAAVIPEKEKTIFHGQMLYHDICRQCGTIVRSYIKEPEKFAGKKIEFRRVYKC